MKKVLIITYYWPPGSGAGVFRWLKFAKYLRDYGWEPVIYTPDNPEAPANDPSLQDEVPDGVRVIRRPILEPYRLYKVLTGRKQSSRFQPGFLNEDKKPGPADRIATWVRGNFFIPDARKYWIRPSVKFLSDWLASNPVDVVVSTGPPHSMHLIALKLKKKLNLPWVADFRDPWTQIDYHHKLLLTARASEKHQQLEKQVLTQADQVVTVSKHCKYGLESLGGRACSVIPNGFDPEDFSGLPSSASEKFCIVHLGSMNADRNPKMLWRLLSEMVKEDGFLQQNLTLKLIGQTDLAVRESIQQHGLTKRTSFIAPLPHREALASASVASIYILPLNNTPNVMGIATSKLFDYLGLQKPILCIGPTDGDAATIIKETNSGTTVGFNDSGQCRTVLLDWAVLHQNNALTLPRQQTGAYHRKKLTKALAGLLEAASSQTKLG